MPVSKKEISPCPIDAMLSVIDGRWKGTVLWKLLDGPMRTGEIHRAIPQMTERMLIRHLQEMVKDGIVVRKEDGVSRAVSYAISRYGLTLVPVLEQICAWGRKHLTMVEGRVARQSCDEAETDRASSAYPSL
jgi:DNA-binding HxlR family transcriptional regulator